MRRQTSPGEERALEELRRLKRRSKSSPGKKRRSRWGRYIALVLLGAACIGGVELAACRFFEPALYERVMEPMRGTVYWATQTAGKAVEAVCRAGAAAARKTGEAAAVLAERAGAAGEALRDWMEEAALPPEPPEETDSALAQPELSPPKDFLDPLISDLIWREGKEILTGGGVEVVYFNQTDEDRAEQMYGSDPLSTHGCGRSGCVSRRRRHIR